MCTARPVRLAFGFNAMDKKVAHSKKQIKRILISRNDILEATNYAYQLLKHKYHKHAYLEKSDEEYEKFSNSDEYENMNALTTALIVSYSRPFTNNDGKLSAIPTLPKKLTSPFNTTEKELHEKILKLRNKAFAHSDADLFDIHLSLSEYDGMLVPTYIDYPLEYFTEAELNNFQNMVEKLLVSFGAFIKSIFDYYGDKAIEYFTE